MRPTPDATGAVRASSLPVLLTPARQGAAKDPPRNVARLLGMTPYEVNRELRKGKSLDDLANERGVPHDELIKAILGGHEGGPKEKRMAERLASLKFPPSLADNERDENGVRTVRRRHADEPASEAARRTAAEQKRRTGHHEPAVPPYRLNPHAEGPRIDLAL